MTKDHESNHHELEQPVQGLTLVRYGKDIIGYAADSPEKVDVWMAMVWGEVEEIPVAQDTTQETGDQ